MKSQSFEKFAQEQLDAYRAMLAFIPKIKEIANKFDGKVVNARFANAIEEAAPTTHIGSPFYVERDVPMFCCRFEADSWNEKKLLLSLCYLNGNAVNHKVSTRFYFLEDCNATINRIYGKPLNAESFCKNCDHNALKIQEEIKEWVGVLATYSEGYDRLREIYNELRGLHKKYYLAAIHTDEWELNDVVNLAKFGAY